MPKAGSHPAMPNKREPTPAEERTKDDPVEYFGADGEDEGQKYVDSGATPEDDDQTAAPG